MSTNVAGYKVMHNSKPGLDITKPQTTVWWHITPVCYCLQGTKKNNELYNKLQGIENVVIHIVGD